MTQDLLLVGFGGMTGSIARYCITLWLRQWMPPPAPWPTLAVNVTGCLLIGILYGWVVKQSGDTRAAVLLLATGVLGGFTTFSAFGLETVELVRMGDAATAAIYALASLVLGFGAVLLGRSLP